MALSDQAPKVSKRIYPGHHFLRASVTEAELLAGLEQAGWVVEKRIVAPWFDAIEPSEPKPRSVWQIGEALRALGIPGMSGLAAMWVFDQVGESAAILGTCDRAMIEKHRGALFAMIASAPYLTHESPYDALRDHRVLNGDADEWSLRQLRDTEVIKCDILDYEFEARLLNERFHARSIWKMPSDLAEALDKAADTWLQRGNEIEAALGFPSELRAAYFIGRLNTKTLSQQDRYYAVQNLIATWLSQIRRPTIEEAIAFAAFSLKDGSSAALSFESIVEATSHVAEALHGVPVEIDHPTLVGLLRAFIEQRIAEQYGFTDDLALRLARDKVIDDAD